MIDTTLFPKVYIRNVDIDLIDTTLLDNKNPHVNDEEHYVKRNPTSGGTPAYYQGRSKPLKVHGAIYNQGESKYVKVPNAALPPSQEPVLTIDIELAFESFKNNTVISNFLDKDFVNKYFRVRVILVPSIDIMHKVLNFENSLIAYTNKLEAQGLINIANTDAIAIDFEATENEDVQDNIIRVNFSHKDLSPEYLSIVAFSYFDIPQMEEDLNLELENNTELFTASSTLTIENVFVNSNLVSDSFLFFDESDELWIGPVTYEDTEDTEDTNYFKYNTTEQLRAERVPNSVVSDYRPFKELQTTGLSLEKLQARLSDKFDTASVHNRTHSPKDQIFSELYLTQDENANSRFAFALNYKNAITQKGRYGFLFRDSDELRDHAIFSNSRILDISVYRTRVEKIKRDNSLGSLIDDVSYFNDISTEVLVVNSSEKQYRNFPIKQFKAINSTNMELAGIIRELDIDMPDVRFFTISDEQIDRLTDGLYTYNINIQIQDGTVTFVNDLYESTRTFLTFLQEYIGEAEMYGNHVLPSGKLEGQYVRRLRLAAHPWREQAVDFVTNLSFMINDLAPEIFEPIKSALNPSKTNLAAMHSLYKIAQNYLQFLEREFVNNSFIRNFSSSKKSVATNRRNSADYAVISLTKNCEAIVDSNIVKHKGMEFIEFLSDQGEIKYDKLNGLSSIKYDKFLQRADHETNKYFGHQNVDIEISTENRVYLRGDNTDTTKYSFFSPSKIKSGEKNTDYLNSVDAFNTLKIADIEISTQEFGGLPNNSTTTIGSFNKQDSVYKKKVSNYTKKMGVTLEVEQTQEQTPAKNILKTEKFVTQDVGVEKVDKKEVNSSFAGLKSIFNAHKNSSGLTSARVDKKIQRDISIDFDLKNSLNAIDRHQMDEGKIKAMPNQLKSLIMGSLGNKQVNKNRFVDRETGLISNPTEEDEATFAINYDNLVKVEGLFGFDTNTEGVMVKSAQWKLLTKGLMEKYPYKELLCRVQRLDSPLAPRKKDGVFGNLPIYNSYFTILFDTSADKQTLEDQKKEIVDEIPYTSIPFAGYMNSGVFSKKK